MMATARKRLTIAAVASAALITVIACSSGSSDTTSDTGDTTDGSGSGKTIRYELAGAGGANNVTYSSDGSGSQSQEANVKLPWSKEITIPDGEIGIPTVTAQRDASAGDITCRILVDGKEVKTSTSSGQYAVVTCAGDVQF